MRKFAIRKHNLSEQSKIPLVPAACVTIALAFIAFFPSVEGNFVFDDSEAIVNNADVLLSTPWTSAFKNDYWGKSILSNSSHKSYRPLTVLTFRLSYYLSSGLHPRGFHMLNLILHAVVSVILLVVFQCVINEKMILETTVSPVSMFSAILFAAHPIHAENVAGIVGRADLLCAIFYFITFVIYSRMCHSLHDFSSSAQRPGFIGLAFTFSVCGVLSFISMLCKEHGITVLGMCSFYDVITTLRRYLFFKKMKGEYPWLPSLAIRVVSVGLIGLAMVLFRFWIMNGSVPVFQEVDNPASFAESWWQRTVNYNYVYALNIWLLLNPTWLCFDWSMGCVPLIHSFFDLRLLTVAVFWITITYILLTCIQHWQTIDIKLTVAVMFMVIPFLPATNLLFKVGFVVAERVLYISSAGFCLLVGLGFQRLYTLSQRSKLISLMGMTCIALFSVKSLQRSMEWCTEERLFHSGLSVCPLNAKVHYNIAKNAADTGQVELAVERYSEALRLHPRYDQAMNNLANILKDQGNLTEAKILLTRSIEIRPNFAAAWMNLGIVNSGLHQFSAAEHCYLTALTHRHHYPDCYYNLGNLYLDLKRYDEAFYAWKNATHLKPTHSVSWNNMIIMLDSTGDLEQAKTVAKEAIYWLPNEASLHFNFANVLGKLGLFEESEKHFLSAIKINNSNSAYFTNLGVLYHRWKHFKEAKYAYTHALKLNPSASTARDNLNLLLEATSADS